MNPAYFRLAAKAYASRIMSRGGSTRGHKSPGFVLLKHRLGMQPWERTLYSCIKLWLERSRFSELRARSGEHKRRARGRPASALRSPVNLRYVTRRLRADDGGPTIRQIADCLVDDIAPRLPIRHRCLLLGAQDAVDRDFVKKTIIEILKRSRSDAIDPAFLR